MNNEPNIDLAITNFIKEFNKLPIIYQLSEFSIRDINLLDKTNQHLDYFLSEYSGPLNNYFDEIFFNDSIVNRIETECYAQGFLNLDEFETTLKNCFIPNDAEDNELFGDELFLKYKDETKIILSDMSRIINIIWDESYHFIQNYSFLDKSLFVSFFNYFYKFDYKDWENTKTLLMQK
jgi:hypothetical protein